MRIDGVFEGDVEIAGVFAVGPGGRTAATIVAGKVMTRGVVRGNVRAKDVHIGPGGRIEGDVYADALAIDDGGALHGGVVMEEGDG